MRITGQLLRSRSKKPLRQVRYLDLSSTNIVTLNQLELCPKLTTLIASHNCLESIPNLDCCPELWKLDLSHNKLQEISGLCRFSVLGCLVLSNNCLDWANLKDLHQTHILELSLHGNPKLEKDPYYRMHVIDSLPFLWMLDGKFITSAERQQVCKFFLETELAEHPVRHKISRKKCFTPTPLQNLAVSGVFGQKTEHWMKRFSLHEKLTQELDRRRLRYLAFNLQEESRLQSQSSNNNESSKIDAEIFTAVIDRRESDREKSNMLLLLVMAALEFEIPEQVLQQTLDIAKLTKIGSHHTKDVFLLPKKQQCSMASLLLSGVKIDRDVELEDGLYDSLYLCLYELISEWHKLTNNHCIPRKSGTRDILAAEVVQLFCIVPAFLMLLGRNTGLLELVSSATKDPDIAEHLYSFVVKEKSKGTKPDEMLHEMGSFILKKVNRKCFQYVHKPATDLPPEKPNPPLRTSSYTNSLNTTRSDSPPRSKSASSFSRRQNIPKTKHDVTRKKIRKSFDVKSLDRSPALGDQVITSDQTSGHIIAMPEKNIVLVKLDRIPAYSLQQLNTRNRKADNGKTGKSSQSGKERNSEAYLARTIRKQLPVEVWMSFSLQNAKPTSGSNDSAISQHVRELVKDCIEHAKTTDETQEFKFFQYDDSSREGRSLLQDTPQEKEEKDIQSNETASARVDEKDLNEDSESIKEEKNDLELEFSVDDNMISKTENERLEAWKFFRPRNLEERGIPDEITSTPYSSSKTPHPSSRIDPDELHRHDVVYTKSGKRISLPLPGWMEDFQSKNRPRPSSTNTSVRYASARSRKSVETERRWTPIILNSVNFSSVASEGFKREKTWEYRQEPHVSQPRRQHYARAMLKPK